MKALGIALLVIGLLMIVITGFNLTTHEKVLDVGPVKVSKEEHHPINWSPIAGAAIAVGGIVVLLVSRRTKIA